MASKNRKYDNTILQNVDQVKQTLFLLVVLYQIESITVETMLTLSNKTEDLWALWFTSPAVGECPRKSTWVPMMHACPRTVKSALFIMAKAKSLSTGKWINK